MSACHGSRYTANEPFLFPPPWSTDFAVSLNILRKGIKLSKKFYETEASGGVTLKNVKKIAATGVDRISVGQLTHSVEAINLKLEI